ncbi:hypothetical protein [Qipengyuania sp. 483]
MSISIKTGPWGASLNSDEDALARLQSILLQNAEGARGGELDIEYRQLRRALLDNPEYSDVVPRLIRIHRDLDSLWPYMKSFDRSWEPRRKHVREEMAPLLDRAEELARGVDAPASGLTENIGGQINSAEWTGIASPGQRLAAARSLIPIAQGSIEQLIEHLSVPNHNGAPPLDETLEAIENLRELHRALGEVLNAVEEGRWNEESASGLVGEASRYAKRAARLLRNDPMPYAVSALLLSVLTTLGFPNIGGYLAGVALAVRKPSE